MKNSILLLFLYLFSYNSTELIRAQSKLVTIEIVKQKNSQELWARNNSYGNLTVNIEYTELNNAYSEPSEPTISLSQGEFKLIATIYPSNSNNAWNYRYNYFWRLGKPDAYADGTVYHLPYKSGKSFNVIQGYNGTFTHFGEQAFAIDFNMSIGTPVLAARGGKVVEIVQKNTGSGTTEYYRNNSNYIRIEHSDGTIAEYTHIKQYGSNVSEGDIVKTGDLIAFSGDVGYSSGPHLHFHVCKPLNGKNIETLPVTFKTSNSDGEELIQGKVYIAP